jgi:hypothetical protein
MEVMAQVRVGMRVLDSEGEELGTVDDLKAGDPTAATGAGQGGSKDGGLMDDLARAFGGGTDLPRQTAERLLRVGYIRINRQGFLAGTAYAPADRLQDVIGDTVRLTVTSERLTQR